MPPALRDILSPISINARHLLARPYRYLAAAAVVVLAACGSGSDPVTGPKPTEGIKAVAGAGVSDTVLAQPLQALVVEVRGADGGLAVGKVVRFSARIVRDTTRLGAAPVYVCSLGALTCGPIYQTGYPYPISGMADTVAADTTDASGRAKATVRLGTIAGPAYVIVSVPEFGVRDSVPYTVQPGAARAVVAASHAIGVSIGGKAVVRAAVVDRFGNARTDAVTLSYSGTSGSAAFDPATGTITGQGLGTGYAYARVESLSDSARVSVIPPGRLLGWDEGTYDVYLVNTDGSNARRLTTPSVTSTSGVFPRFSVSGASLAYHSGTQSYAVPPTRIVVMDSSGANPRTISPPTGVTAIMYPRPLADGSVLFVGSVSPYFPTTAALYRSAADGTITQLAALPGLSTVEGAADISPDGTKVAYVTADAYGNSNGIQVLTVATGQSTVIDASGQVPQWSVAGDRLAYLTGTFYTDNAEIVVNSADGTARRVVDTGSLVFNSQGGLAWSPDGTYLLANSGPYYTFAVTYVVRVSDGVHVPLSLGPSGTLYQPDWR